MSSFLDEKTLDIVLEDGADFGYRLTLVEVEEVCTNHPVTGEAINCKEVESPIPITDVTFSGKISKSLDEGSTPLLSFTFTIESATKGVLRMSLTDTQVKSLVTQASTERDKYNPRLRFLGYYDIISTHTPSSVDTRLMQGKVYISDGVTS